MMNSQNSNGQWYSWMFSRMTVFFALGVLAAGTYVAKEFSNSSNPKIAPNIKASILSHTRKARSPIHAKIELDDQAPESIGDEFTLEVKITTEHDANDVNARWILPEGIELVQGSQRLEIYEIEKGEEKVFQTTFKQLSEANEQIHFKLTGKATGMRSSLTLQYNSMDQQEIDQLNKNLREVASEQMKKDLAIDAMEKGHSHSHSHVAE